MPTPEKIALLSDIHGNSPALRAVLDDVARQDCARVFVLGDIINGVDPHECMELLRSIGDVTCILGNAESGLLTPDLDLFPTHRESMYADLVRLFGWYRAHLTQVDLEWLRQLPATWRWDGAYLVHDSPADRVLVEETCPPEIDGKYREFIYHGKGIKPNLSDAEFAEIFAWMRSQHLSKMFCAHTHLPFYRRDGDRVICNVGSVGIPLDGDPRPSWVLLDEMESKITIRRIDYAVDDYLAMIDQTTDYPDFSQPNFQRAYKKMLQTGVHWKAHLE